MSIDKKIGLHASKHPNCADLLNSILFFPSGMLPTCCTHSLSCRNRIEELSF